MTAKDQWDSSEPPFLSFKSSDQILMLPPLKSIYDCDDWNELNKSVIAAALLATAEPIECEMARWVTKPPTASCEAEGFGPGGQVVPLLGTEPLKSPQLENVVAVETTRGLHYRASHLIHCRVLKSHICGEK